MALKQIAVKVPAVKRPESRRPVRVDLHAEFLGRMRELRVSEVALLLMEKEADVREWIRSKGMPTNKYSEPLTLSWPDVLRWYVLTPGAKRVTGGKRPICRSCGGLL